MRSLRLTHEQIQAIVDHARQDQPHEACGIISGNGDVVARIMPIHNIARNPQHHYRMDAKDLLQVLKNMNAAGEEMLGVYHSHPKHEPIPSSEDIREAQLNTPNMVHVILSLKYGKTRLQAWHIHDGLVDKVELLVGNQLSLALAPMTRAQTMAIILATILALAFLLIISLNLLPPAPSIPTPQ
jgi:proteasome lid subunit RPN8/RPN11